MNKIKLNTIISVNLGVFLSSCIIILLMMYATRNAMFSMNPLQAVAVLSLCSIFIFVPDFFKKDKMIILLCMFIVLPFVGVIFKDYSIILNWTLIVSGIFVFVYNFRNFKKIKFIFITLSFLSSLFLILLVYSSNLQILSPVFGEIIVNGKAVPDTLFHASVSNSLLFDHVVSTRIHGNSPFNYHWFSHFAYAGFAQWTGLKSIAFYNWAYPAFIIPLFIKYLFIFYKKMISYFGFSEINSGVFFPGLLLYILIFLGATGLPSYLSSESLMLSHIFQFIFWILVLKYRTKIISDFGLTLLLFSTLILLLFTKASVGLLTFIPAFYLYFRFSENAKNHLCLALFSTVYIAVCYFYFFSIRTSTASTGFLIRLLNFSSGTISFVSYAASIFWMILFFVQKEISYQKIISNVWNRKYIFEELIVISLGCTFVFGIFFGTRKDDAFYFGSTFIFLNFVILVILFLRYFKIDFKIEKFNFAVVSIIILCFILTPQLAMTKHNTYNEKLQAQKQNPTLKNLLISLYNEKTEPRKIITLAPENDWFYKSQKLTRITYYFIPSGMSDLPALLPILNEDLESGIYSFGFYNPTSTDISKKEELLKQAKKLGYEEIVYFTSENNNLKRELLKLTNPQ